MTATASPKPTRRLELQPITFSEAAEFVRLHHRHHPPPLSWRFGCAVNDGGPGARVVGVVIVGRPVARHLDQDGFTAEVTRLCTDGTPNAASMLLRAAWRAARALGYRRLITYTLTSESGTSLRAAGFHAVYETRSKSWHTPSRPRIDKHSPGQRTLWELV